jgi:hypothetical protein
MISKAPTQLTKEGSNSREQRKNRDPRHIDKRLRTLRSAAPPGEVGKVSGFTDDSRMQLLEEPTTQGRLAAPPPSIHENDRAVSRAHKKRTRAKFETGQAASDADVPVNSYEDLGPDKRRIRPLPKKIFEQRFTRSSARDAISGNPCEAPSFENTEQVSQDAAGDLLTVLREGVESDLPDWTQDVEPDAECDDLGVHDQDEATDDHVIAASSVSSITVPKPPLPAPPPIWAQVSHFIIRKTC